MPGYVMHIAMAEMMLDILDKKDDGEWSNRFLVGNIIPDMWDRSQKKASHFWDDETLNLLARKPNIEMFCKKYGGKLSNPYVFGYLCHLYLDKFFIEKYWEEHFTFYNNKMNENRMFDEVLYVSVKEHEEIYKREDFFSNKLYYGDYDRINNYIFDKYKIDTNKIVSYMSLGKSEDFNIIDEVQFEKAKAIFKEAFQEISSDSKDDGKPHLLVFKLEELEKLIEDTAFFLCKYYNIHKNVT